MRLGPHSQCIVKVQVSASSRGTPSEQLKCLLIFSIIIHHPSLMETGKGDGGLRLDENHNARLGRQNVVEGRQSDDFARSEELALAASKVSIMTMKLSRSKQRLVINVEAVPVSPCGLLAAPLPYPRNRATRRRIFAISSRHRLMFTIGPATPMFSNVNPYATLHYLGSQLPNACGGGSQLPNA